MTACKNYLRPAGVLGGPCLECGATQSEHAPNSLSFPNHLPNTTPLDPTPDNIDWEMKQRLASPSRYYGNGGTIHRTGKINVELDKDGKVVSVWFRCCMLPFDQTVVGDSRANEMRKAYKNDKLPQLTGVEVLDA